MGLDGLGAGLQNRITEFDSQHGLFLKGEAMFLALKDHLEAGTEREDISLLMRRIVYREGGMQNVLKELLGIIKEERGRKDEEYLLKLERDLDFAYKTYLTRNTGADSNV